jgi:hypothetical protein
MRVPLREIAHLRSGDKGDTSNVAVIAYDLRFVSVLTAQLTADVVADAYQGRLRGGVTRFVVPHLGVANFVLHGALGGGVSRSLNADQFGKALCSRMLSIDIDVPDDLVGLLRSNARDSGPT